MDNTQSTVGFWPAHFDIKAVFSQPAAYQYPQIRKNYLYWLESRANESGRRVLMRMDLRDRSQHCITPKGFDIRTRVHEYGGRCHVIDDDAVWFSNNTDGRIYYQSFKDIDQVIALTPATSDLDHASQFSDLTLTPDHKYLLFIQEIGLGQHENQNRLSYLGLIKNDVVEPTALHAGVDFYSRPGISSDGKSIFWLQWSHPDMPWDETQLMTAKLVPENHGLSLSHVHPVIKGQGISIQEYVTLSDNRLVFAMDRSNTKDDNLNYANLYLTLGGKNLAVTSGDYEYAYPHWVFGENRCTQVADNKLLSVATRAERDYLVLVDVESATSQIVEGEFEALQYPCKAVDNAGYRATVSAITTNCTSVILGINAKTGNAEQLLRANNGPQSTEISHAESMRYKSSHGYEVQAFFYLPVNPGYQLEPDELPPLVVMAHGGPTARTNAGLNLSLQYWTASGFAVLDVNYCGSSGFGRRYRDQLYGGWGLRDVEDVIAGIDHLKAMELIDGANVFIRGSSAGGYLVLQALTHFGDRFCAGASYYGIGDLSSLLNTTHKFEQYYLDHLIGEASTDDDTDSVNNVYYQRSPINYLDKLTTPVILFQGVKDKVVPPQQARQVIEVLKNKGVDHEYYEYANEGHGFKDVATKVDSLTRELAFYRKVLMRHRHSITTN